MSLPGPDLGTRQWLRRNDEKLHEKSVFFARSATGFCTPKMRVYRRLCRCRSFWHSRCRILERALLLASLLLSVTNAPSATARRRSAGGAAAPTFTGATSAPSTATPENVPVLSLTFATRPWANGARRVFCCILVENLREGTFFPATFSLPCFAQISCKKLCFSRVF